VHKKGRKLYAFGAVNTSLNSSYFGVCRKALEKGGRVSFLLAELCFGCVV
jgi:hypothetical protein